LVERVEDPVRAGPEDPHELLVAEEETALLLPYLVTPNDQHVPITSFLGDLRISLSSNEYPDSKPGRTRTFGRRTLPHSPRPRRGAPLEPGVLGAVRGASGLRRGPGTRRLGRRSARRYPRAARRRGPLSLPASA